MGERLVVTFKRNDKPFAAMYFHWSAYTIPATGILKEIASHYLPQIIGADNDFAQLKLIKFAEKMYECGYSESEDFQKEQMYKDEIIEMVPPFLQEILHSIFNAHGGLCASDRLLAMSKWPNETFDENVNRNQGLVAISDDEIEEMLNYAQMIVEIDIDNMKIFNGTIYEYSLEEYMEETVEDPDFVYPDELIRSPIDLSEFEINDLEFVFEILLSAENGWIRFNDKCYRIKNM